ncbi:MAG: 50S ribosomal protein L11 methyltransferase [Gammaproteobacteria bacterium]|nr:50S ribosomal protein L11 methyltransferase [Gammaproteobacteria bacterium]
MPWLQAHLVVDRENVSRVEQALLDLGAISITLGDAADEPLLEPDPGESPLWRLTCISALFAPEIQPKALRQSLSHLLSGNTRQTLRFEHLADQVWERAWLADFRPMQFGKRLWVCPDGQRPEGVSGLFIDLDPGLAFGTGTHPTTALCLKWLDRNPPCGQSVVDFGCGSGILGIAALKLGARSVIAIDHDPQALEATQANALKNGVSDRLQTYPSTEVPRVAADLLLANILADTLIDLKPRLASLVHPQGTVLLSGILLDQVDRVTSVYSPDFEVLPPVSLEDWVLLIAKPA